MFKADRKKAQLTTDASGMWGCGGWTEINWFQLKWDDHSIQLHITIKGLIPIMIAVMIWGNEWQGSTILVYCDNEAVVAILSSRYCKEPRLVHML